MRHLSFTQFVLLTGLCAVAACSQGADKSASDHDSHSTASAASRVSAAAPADRAANDASSDADGAPIIQIDCARIFKPEDTIPILGAPSKISNYPSRNRSCEFEASNGSTLAVYGGKGDDLTSTVEFNQATIPANAGQYAKLGGVGDQAYWRKDHSEITSRKGDLWCSVSGGPPNHSEAEARKLGELCNKVYASGL
ncbi:MAG: hypothetical protein ABI379_07510 [Rhodanobacter sp.]